MKMDYVISIRKDSKEENDDINKDLIGLINRQVAINLKEQLESGLDNFIFNYSCKITFANTEEESELLEAKEHKAWMIDQENLNK